MDKVTGHRFGLQCALHLFFPRRRLCFFLLILLSVSCHLISKAENDFSYLEQYDRSVCITAYHGDASVVEIPEMIGGYPVTAIDGFFPQHCEKLVIPDSVICLGDGFFWNTEEFVVSSGHTVFTCRAYALYEKNGERLLAYPTREGELIEIPEGTRIIDKNVIFLPGPQVIALPESLTEIENAQWGSPFSTCSTLREFRVPASSGSYCCADHVLYDKAMQTLIAYPAGKEGERFTVPDGVQSIEDFAFHGSAVSSLTVPESVSACGKFLFSNTASLQELVFEGAGEQPLLFDEYAFQGADLATVTVPSRTVQISDYAFASGTIITCSAGTYAESWCQEHSHPYASYMGNVLENGTLEVHCASFSGDTVAVPAFLDGQPVSTLAERAFWLSYDGLLLPRAIPFHSIILPEGLRTLRNEAFRGCTELKHISLPASVTELEGNPFHNPWTEGISTAPGSRYEVRDDLLYEVDTGRLICCFNAAGLPDEYTIPEYIRSLSPRAFAYGSFKKVMIPDTVTTAGDNPFYSCQRLEEIAVSPEHLTLAVISGVLYSKTDKRLVCLPCALQLSCLEVPRGIRMIGGYAAAGYNHITEIVLPETVTHIGEEAFAYSTELERVSLPEGLKRIDDWAFECCERLTGVDLPGSLESLGHSAFLNCTALEQIRLPEGIDNIPYGAFSGCALQDISLPDSTEEIGAYAFYACSRLEKLHIPEKVTKIGHGAFENCPGLTLELERDSYAVEYCKDNHLAYTYADALSWLDE